MNRHLRKPFAGRHREESEQRHWLNQGSLGQESLLVEFDPYLYAADQAVSSIATALAHELDHHDEKPYAVLMPPAEAIGWQLAHLSRLYNVYIWSENCDELLGLAADQFGAKIINGDLEGEIEHQIDFFLATAYCWPDAAQFGKTLREARRLLSPLGKACFVLTGEGEPDKITVQWAASSASTLHEIETGELLASPAAEQSRKIMLSAADPAAALPAFLKRNRDFFGRNMREVFLERMQEADFKESFRPASAQTIWALALVWSASFN